MYFNRITENLSKRIRTMVLQTLPLNIINYGIKIWGSSNLTHIQRAQKAQNFAAKVALGGKKHDHVTPYFKELKWLKIKEKYKYEVILRIYHIINKKVPSWLFSLPTTRETHTVNTTTRTTRP